MIRMKALRSFGVERVNEGHVSRGREFKVVSEHRARDLEDHGLAYRVASPALHVERNELPPGNNAAEAGPLASVGGMTGESEPVPSSLPAPRRRGRPPGSKNRVLPS